jgi:hypothetical protein
MGKNIFVLLKKITFEANNVNGAGDICANFSLSLLRFVGVFQQALNCYQSLCVLLEFLCKKVKVYYCTTFSVVTQNFKLIILNEFNAI